MNKDKLIQKYNNLLKGYAETDLLIVESEDKKKKLIEEIQKTVSIIKDILKEEAEQDKLEAMKKASEAKKNDKKNKPKIIDIKTVDKKQEEKQAAKELKKEEGKDPS